MDHVRDSGNIYKRTPLNWEAISAVGEILGVIVVVITLIYLAAQVRQGNLFAKAQARQRMVEQAEREIYMQMADPSITYANVKDGPISEEEQAKLALFLIAFMRQREWEWFQWLSRSDCNTPGNATWSKMVESHWSFCVQCRICR